MAAADVMSLGEAATRDILDVIPRRRDPGAKYTGACRLYPRFREGGGEIVL
jgi:hypothetical protein